MQIEFTVAGDPVGQGRPRFARRRGYVQTYDPPKSKEYKAKVAQSFQQAYMGEPLTNPVKITIRAVFGVPKSYSKERTKACLEGLEWPTKKPDFDNIVKGVCDALNGLAYQDDKQIVQAIVYKLYGPEAKVEVIIEELNAKNKAIEAYAGLPVGERV